MEKSILPQAPAALSTAEERPVSIAQKAIHIDSLGTVGKRKKHFSLPEV